MPPIGLHAATVPVMTRLLANLQALLDKGEAFAEARAFDPGNLLSYRLAPDMYSLSEHVRAACQYATTYLGRTIGAPAPENPHGTGTFAQARAHIGWTIAHLEAIPPAAVDDMADRPVEFTFIGQQKTMLGFPYLRDLALPNVYFHVAAAYMILRHNGVVLSKVDFLLATVV